MPSTPTTIRIFISSPGDVVEERHRARQVIEGLRRRYSRYFLLKPVLWEDMPLQADMSFQRGIDLVLSKEHGVDVAIFILWSRLGSAVGPLITKHGGGEYRSGTERELDLMLQARKQGDGTRPAIIVYMRKDEASFDERLRGRRTSEKEELLAQKRLVETFIEETFYDQASGHNIGAKHSFDRPVTFSQRLRAHLIELLDPLAGEMTETVWDIDKQGPPFLGLLAFQPEHADVFFGRDEEILEARFALREQAKQGCAFLLLTGASGSGKSSLARAGILPDIVQHEVDEQVVAWRSLVVTPAELTGDPILALVRRLAGAEVLPELRGDGTSLEKLARGLREQPQNTFDFGVQPAFDQLSARQKGHVRLLLVIDQLEEMFAAHVMTADDRQALLCVIETFARSGAVWVLATARSDFYHQIQGEPSLARLLENRGPMPVLPPGPDALQRLIEEPARLAGLRFEDREGVSLASRILRDAAAHAELLPLVEFVLREMFEGRTADGLLTTASYDQLGGVEGAIGKKAEEAFQSLSAESQAAFTEILPLLVTVEVAGEQSAVRRRAPLDDLQSTPARRALTGCLIANRFLTTDREKDETPIASLAHEALLRHWNRIATWITSNREHLRLRARVEHGQHGWDSQGQHSSLLLPSGLLLEEGQVLLREARPLLLAETTDYIERSVTHRQSESRRQRLIRATAMAMSLTAALIAIVAALWINTERNAAVAAKNSEATAKTEESKAKSAAQVEAQKAKDALVRNHRDRGIAECQAGQIDRGMCYLLRAYDTATEDSPLRDEALRLLAGWGNVLEVRLHHGESVIQAVAFSPDSKMVLTGGNDNQLRLWDANTGRPVGKPMAHPSSIGAAVFSPDGQRVLSCAGRAAYVWDVETGKQAKQLSHEEFPEEKFIVQAVAFSPDGSVIATGASRGIIRLLEASTGRLIRLWRVTDDEPPSNLTTNGYWGLGLAFSPDGKTLLSGGTTEEPGLQKLRCWDATTGQRVGELIGSISERPLAFSPDHKTFLTDGKDGLQLWDAVTREPIGTTLPMGFVAGAEFSLDGANVMAVSMYKDAAVYSWDARTGEKLARRVLTIPNIRAAAFSRDGRKALIGCESGVARLVTIPFGPMFLGELDGSDGYGVVDAAYSSDGKALLGLSQTWKEGDTHSFRFHFRQWDARTLTPLGEPIESLELDSEVYGFHPGRKIVITGKQIWDATTGRAIVPLEDPDPFEHLWVFFEKNLAISTDGRTMITNGADNPGENDDFRTGLWDLTTGKRRGGERAEGKLLGANLAIEGFVYRVALSPDGMLAATAGSGIRLWDTATAKPVGESMRFLDAEFLAFGLDGKSLLVGSREIHRYDTLTRKPIGKPMRHDGRVNKVVFSRDGKMMLTTATDKDTAARLWDVATGEPIGELLRHESEVSDVAFSPDGRMVLTAANEGVHLWDVVTGKPIGLPMGGVEAKRVAFSPDGQTFLSRSSGGNHVWRVPRPFAHEPERLRAWVEVRTGQYWDKDVLRPLSQMKWLESWQRLEKLGGPPSP